MEKTILKKSTIRLLEEYLDLNHYDNFISNGSSETIVFELDKDGDQTIVFDFISDKFLSLTAYIETSVNGFKKIFGILDILSKTENVENLCVSVNHSHFEDANFDTFSQDTAYINRTNLYKLLKHKLNEIADRKGSVLVSCNNQTQFVYILNYRNNPNAHFALCDLLKDLEFDFSFEILKEKTKFSLKFVSKTIFIHQYTDGHLEVTDSLNEEIHLNGVPSKKVMLETINSILF